MMHAAACGETRSPCIDLPLDLTRSSGMYQTVTTGIAWMESSSQQLLGEAS